MGEIQVKEFVDNVEFGMREKDDKYVGIDVQINKFLKENRGRIKSVIDVKYDASGEKTCALLIYELKP